MHRARNENPLYFTMLKTLGEVAEEVVSPRITEEELVIWQAQPLGSTNADTVRQAHGASLWSSDSVGLLGAQEQALLGARQFDTFTAGNRDHSFIKERIQRDLTDAGMPDAFRTTDVIAYTEGGYSRFLPMFDEATPYQGAMRIITARLKADACQLNATLALGGDKQHELLVRVGKRDRGVLPNRAAMDTFIEGYESIAFAGAHLRLGGTAIATNVEGFARAVTGYTALAPGSGMLAPMAMRGEYFYNLAESGGRLTQPYRIAFTARQHRLRVQGKTKPFVYDEPSPLNVEPPYSPAYCNAVGFPAKLPEMYIPEYETEGCGGLLNKVVFNAARLFGAKVAELVATEPPEVVPLNFAPHIKAGRAVANALL